MKKEEEGRRKWAVVEDNWHGWKNGKMIRRRKEGRRGEDRKDGMKKMKKATRAMMKDGARESKERVMVAGGKMARQEEG